MNWIKLNNQVIIKDNEGKYQLDKDKEALNSYLDEYISPKIKKFNNLEEKLQYLIENEYYCKDTLNKYSLSFITNLFDFIDVYKRQTVTLLAPWFFAVLAASIATFPAPIITTLSPSLYEFGDFK